MSEQTEAALRPFTLACPYCGEQDAAVAVILAQLDCEQFRCLECEQEFKIADVESIIDRWQKVIAWVRSVPQFPQE